MYTQVDLPIQIRKENEIVPDGISITDCTSSGGRIHLNFQFKRDNETIRFHLAFKGHIDLITVLGYVESFDKGEMVVWPDKVQC